ncbi:hypothetical protein LEM8419_02896 [Neolewinella maritima]|uniref:Rhodanese domain-containing protein n=1 Tax=Neolewinella maritima TaxID=1383882 RepID=A0ABN8F4Y6_9BACT|nr:HesA/MoeB/ThiF family protein [Neolewinella maritima]CAH1001981.1 hypothetical protein LEM8419_02896 [Neolewinella maritima]
MDQRYSRQTILDGVGEEGQARLTVARVVIVGCGGLGSPAAAYLAAAGVGTIRLIDGDTPELSNLHRQVFYSTDRPGTKVQQLADHLRRLNPTVKIQTHDKPLDEANVRSRLRGGDLVLDCTDDARTKHLINDACVLLQLPLVYAAAQGFAGYLAVFENRAGGVHLRDVYPEPDPSLPDCATAGVLPTAVGIVAMLQANAALCYLLQIGNPPIDQLLTYNALDNSQHRVRLQKSYEGEITLPAPSRGSRTRADLEVVAESLTPVGYTTVFSMLSEEREPTLPEGVVRLDTRDPLGDSLSQMRDGEPYLLYCNSGKLSLVLAAQLRKTRPELQVYSLKGGIKAL